MIEKGDGTGQIAASCPVTITCVCHESRWCIRSRLARSRASAKTEFSLCVSPRSVFVSANRLSPSLSHPAAFYLFPSFSHSPLLTLSLSPRRSSIFLPTRAPRCGSLSLDRARPALSIFFPPARSLARAKALPEVR